MISTLGMPGDPGRRQVPQRCPMLVVGLLALCKPFCCGCNSYWRLRLVGLKLRLSIPELYIPRSGWWTHHGHHFWRALDFEDFCRTIWHPFCVKKAKPAPSLKSGVRYTSTEKNVKFLASTKVRQRGAEFWERPSRRHFMDPERYEKVENRAKKVEIFEVARVIVPKIV